MKFISFAVGLGKDKIMLDHNARYCEGTNQTEQMIRNALL